LIGVGIDVGGTKTSAIVVDTSTGRVERLVAEGANPAVIGVERAKAVIARLLARVKEIIGGDIEAVGVGSAGVGRGFWTHVYLEAIRQAGLSPRIVGIYEDHCVAHFSCFRGGDGLVLVSGTGSSVYAVCRGHAIRVGGWGHLIDDDGSAYQVGRDGIRAALLYYDGRAEPTKLLDRLLRFFGVDEPRLVIPRIYGAPNPKLVVASFAPIVVELAREGDPVARRVLRSAVEHMEELVEAGLARMRILGCGRGPVAIVGGFAEGVRELVDELLRKLESRGVETVRSCAPQDCGALAYALYEHGCSEWELVLEMCIGGRATPHSL